jgi:Cys-tRNA(Pro)/Cys-tRNA(Cys) deacylase
VGVEGAGGGSTPAVAAVARARLTYAVHRYDPDPAGGGWGRGAAAALGVAPERVFKTLVASVDGKLVVAVVPVTGDLDLKALAAAFGGKRAVMADPVDAERATGYVLGGISPLGQKRRLPTVVDASALGASTVFVSGGRRGLELELAPGDLIRLAGAGTAHMAKGDSSGRA